MRGDRRAGVVPGPLDEVGEHRGAQLPDRALVTVLLQQHRELVDQVEARRGDRGGQVRGQGAHALPRGGVDAHVGLPLGLLAPSIDRIRIDRQQRRDRPLAQGMGDPAGGLGQQPGLHLPRHIRVGVLQHVHQDLRPRLVQHTLGQRRPGAGQRLPIDPGPLRQQRRRPAPAVEDHRQLGGEELRDAGQLGIRRPRALPCTRSPGRGVEVVRGVVGQAQHQFRLVGGGHRLDGLHPRQLGGLLLPGQQADRQPLHLRRPGQEQVEQTTGERRLVLLDLLHGTNLRPGYDSSRRSATSR
ncbi:hypothetical protein [Geodermatophilus dictyosporus]|uniref:hypothetical protein n=1 Tax=Geodermatophilus dictyosporus TaxID=1523247 RepID=UPI000B856F31|nr:hypothetical protein [Geodermatophilus dictyosporus]